MSVVEYVHNKKINSVGYDITKENTNTNTNNDNDYNDDEDMCASVWLNFWWLILISTLVTHGRESQLQGVKIKLRSCVIRVFKYKRRNTINEVDIMQCTSRLGLKTNSLVY